MSEQVSELRTDRGGSQEPRYDEALGMFVCECGAPDRAFIQHENDYRVLVCAACFATYNAPEEGPWTFADIACDSASPGSEGGESL